MAGIPSNFSSRPGPFDTFVNDAEPGLLGIAPPGLTQTVATSSGSTAAIDDVLNSRTSPLLNYQNNRDDCYSAATGLATMVVYHNTLATDAFFSDANHAQEQLIIDRAAVQKTVLKSGVKHNEMFSRCPLVNSFAPAILKPSPVMTTDSNSVIFPEAHCAYSGVSWTCGALQPDDKLTVNENKTCSVELDISTHLIEQDIKYLEAKNAQKNCFYDQDFPPLG
eukprot:GHVL01040910.1.p1 GENE.GHVL01040910.1~~GHVL01040910.1.p1  ORF type:complete len:222 (-),score=14.55 GHVL01040910.1:2016-2681(-)